MRKKLLLASTIIVPVLAIGGLWVYQVNRFENSVHQQLSTMQEFLNAHGVSFTYDALKISRFCFKVHLINPKVSGRLPKISDELKDLEGLKGTYFVKGEIVGSFSPLMNTVTLVSIGGTHLNVEGSVELDMLIPESKESKVIIQRKEYDLFGKNSFLSLHNIKGFYFIGKEMPVLLNGQKLLEIKDTRSDASLEYKGKALDVTLISDYHQLQIYNITEFLKGKMEGLDDLNAMISKELSLQAALGPQDQKASLTMHLNDAEAYFANVKALFAKGVSKENIQDFEALFPEGTQLVINDFSTENKVYQNSMKGSLERLKDQFPIKISGDFKVTDQWENYWQEYHKKIISEMTDAELPAELLSILKNEKVSKNIMPQLQTFGKMHFSIDLEIPIPLSLAAGKASVNFKSDLYDVSVKGALKQEGGSLKVNARNANDMMKDLEQYVARASAGFTQKYSSEIMSIHSYLQGGRVVLNKILEPQEAKEQHFDIQVNASGIKVGTYDLAELLALFNQALPPSDISKANLKVP